MSIEVSWWSFFGGVIGTLLLRQVSRYLDQPTDWLLGHLSKSLAKRLQGIDRRFKEEVEQHLRNPDLIPITGFESARCEIRGFFYRSFGIFLFLMEHTLAIINSVSGSFLSMIFVFAIPGTVLIAGFYNLGRSAKLSVLLSEIKRARNANLTETA